VLILYYLHPCRFYIIAAELLYLKLAYNLFDRLINDSIISVMMNQ